MCLVVGVRLCSTVWIWGDCVVGCVTHNHIWEHKTRRLCPLTVKALTLLSDPEIALEALVSDGEGRVWQVEPVDFLIGAQRMACCLLARLYTSPRKVSIGGGNNCCDS